MKEQKLFLELKNELLKNEELLETMLVLMLYDSIKRQEGTDNDDASIITYKDFKHHSETLAYLKEQNKPTYEELLAILTNNLTHNGINQKLLTIYLLAKQENIALITEVAKSFYLMKKHKGTTLTRSLKTFYGELLTLEEALDKQPTTKTDLKHYYNTKLFYYLITSAFFTHNKTGKYEDAENATLIEGLVNKTYLTDFKTTFKTKNADYIINYWNNTLRDAKACFDARSLLELIVKETAEEKHLTKNEQREIEKKVNDAIKQLNKDNRQSPSVYNLNYIASLLTFDKETEAIFKKPMNIKRFDVKDHAGVSTPSEEWLKSNTSKQNRDILDARASLTTYKECNEKALEKKLATLRKKKPTKQTQFEIKETEQALASIKEEQKRLEKEINQREQEKSEAIKEYEKSNLTKEEQDALEKTIRKLTREIERLKHQKNDRGNYLQIDLYNNVTVNKKNISLSLPIKSLETERFTREGNKLLRYMQDQFYYNPDAERIIIDLEEYAKRIDGETTTSPDAYKMDLKRTRDRIRKALNGILEEQIKIEIKDPSNELEAEIKFYIIVTVVEVKHKGKTTFAVTLNPDYKKILLTQKTHQWASIPKLLNQMGTTPKDARTSELGFYFYEQLRMNIRKSGKYDKTFKLKTLVIVLQTKGLLEYKGRYGRNIINPMQDALNGLEDIGLITYKTTAFKTYDTGTTGTTEEKIKTTFEEDIIKINFIVADTETYNKISASKKKKLNKQPTNKTP